MTRKIRKPLSLILSVMMIVSVFAVVPLTANAAPTESLLTTIMATGKEQASYSTANVATISFSYTEEGSSAYFANWGWWGYGWKATVAAVNDEYTITKCVFYDNANHTATDSSSPFVVETTEDDKTPLVNGSVISGSDCKGIKKIEVYGYSTPTTYTVTWKNYDGSVLETDADLAEGATPEYNGNEPTKPEDDENTYEFAGWNDGETTYGLNDVLPNVTGEVTYTAVFDSSDKHVAAVISMIAALPAPENVTVNDKVAIEAAGYAYAALTTEQRALVPAASVAKLQAVAQAFSVVAKEAADQAAADGVTYLINQIPAEVTLDATQAIEDARAAYNMLTDDQKALVDANTLAYLEAAEAALADLNAANAVTEMINALPTTVTADDAQDIADARAAYAALTDDQKALVDANTLANLEAAEAALEAATRTYTKYDANDATCSAEGNIEYYVGSDGKFYTDDQGTPLADLNNDGVVDINDTVTEKTPHEYVETIVQPKNGEQGYLLHTCSVCQHSYKDNFFDAPLKNKSYIETEAKVGEVVNLFGDAEGGVAGYTYAFMYRKITTETWTKIGKKYGTATSAKFTPGKATVYEVMINVKDNIGKVKSKTYTIDLRTELTNKTTVNAETITLGEKIVLNGAASGGTVTPTNGYKYAFYYKKSKNTDWIEMKPAYTTKSASVRPKTAQSYDVKSVVMDAEGNTNEVTYTVNVTK